MQVEMIPIAEIIPYDKNPRKNSKAVDVVTKSIKEFGFRNPILIDKSNTIIAGHTRLRAAIKLGMQEVPVIWVEDLNKDQIKAFRIMDNKSSEFADWDMDLLKDELKFLDSQGFDVELTGFSSIEAGDIIGGGEIKDDDFVTVDAYERAKQKTKVQNGDIYLLGDHRLMCGDATIEINVEKLMHAEKADILFTDPPYGLGGYAGRSGKFSPMEGDDKDPGVFHKSLPKDIPERYIWANWEVLKSLKEMPRDVIVWKKNSFGMGRGYRGQYEICLYYGNFSGSDSDLWEIDKEAAINYEHPTQKPITLAVRAFKNSPGKRVLDLYGGSGSTLIACERTNRKCFMMEIDPVYCQVIIDRWEKLTKRKAEKI